MNDYMGFLASIGCDKMVERDGSGADVYGSKIICTCPLHDDGRPSFMLRLAQPHFWNCFVCGKGAGLVNLAKKALGVTEGEALAHTSRYVNLAELQLRKKHDGPLELTPYTENCLAAFTRRRYVAAMYMAQRGFLSHVLAEHDIGYDRRRNRVTMPIRRPDGRIVAIMGRAVNKKAKYRQLVYDGRGKETLLLGSHDIAESGDIYVVEGQFDYLKLKQFGCSNVIALLNSKVTDYQLDYLISQGRRLRLFLDNDKAGANGAVYIINKCKGKVPTAVPCYAEEDTDPGDFTKERFKELDASAVSPWKREINKFV